MVITDGFGNISRNCLVSGFGLLGLSSVSIDLSLFLSQGISLVVASGDGRDGLGIVRLSLSHVGFVLGNFSSVVFVEGIDLLVVAVGRDSVWGGNNWLSGIGLGSSELCFKRSDSVEVLLLNLKFDGI